MTKEEELAREVLQLAHDRLADMLRGDDGQAWKEAERAMPLIKAALDLLRVAPAEQSQAPQAVPAEPVAWLVYLPSEQAQHVYDSQADSGYIEDLTNNPDAEVTPLYAAPQPVAVPQWQPIETAPKYSAHILAFGDGSTFTRCSFIASWGGKDRGWLESFSALQATPSHWMPLPAAPGAAAPEEPAR